MFFSICFLCFPTGALHLPRRCNWCHILLHNEGTLDPLLSSAKSNANLDIHRSKSEQKLEGTSNMEPMYLHECD